MKAYRKRANRDGIVEVKLKLNPRTGNYLDKSGELFCCSDGIYTQTVEWPDNLLKNEPEVEGVTDPEITFVISRLKPSDGICKRIWLDELSEVSHSAQEAYMAAAGNKRSAWYWIEH